MRLPQDMEWKEYLNLIIDNYETKLKTMDEVNGVMPNYDPQNITSVKGVVVTLNYGDIYMDGENQRFANEPGLQRINTCKNDITSIDLNVGFVVRSFNKDVNLKATIAEAEFISRLHDRFNDSWVTCDGLIADAIVLGTQTRNNYADNKNVFTVRIVNVHLILKKRY